MVETSPLQWKYIDRITNKQTLIEQIQRDDATKTNSFLCRILGKREFMEMTRKQEDNIKNEKAESWSCHDVGPNTRPWKSRRGTEMKLHAFLTFTRSTNNGECHYTTSYHQRTRPWYTLHTSAVTTVSHSLCWLKYLRGIQPYWRANTDSANRRNTPPSLNLMLQFRIGMVEGISQNYKLLKSVNNQRDAQFL